MRQLWLGVFWMFPSILLGQEIVEPISFRGYPVANQTGFIARMNLHQDPILGQETNLVFMQDAYVPMKKHAALFATIPISITINDLLGDDLAFANMELGALILIKPAKNLGIAIGSGFGLPIFDDVEGMQAGFLANDANLTLHVPDVLSVRPQVRVAYAAKYVSLQGNVGPDIGFGVNNAEDITFLRGGLGAALYVTQGLALQTEVSFNADLTNGNFAPLLGHAGFRWMRLAYDKLVQPGLGVFFPLNGDAGDLVDVGFAMDFRVSLAGDFVE